MVRNDPGISLKDLKKQFPNEKYNSIKTYRLQAKKDISKGIPKKRKKKSIPPQNTPLTFIDDPDELLLSVSMRMLNKPEPDPRWANVLITTRRENIGKSKKEGNIQSKFKSMSISEVSKILARKQENISLKKDLKESS